MAHRSRPDGENTGHTRFCKSTDCGVVFFTVESLISHLDVINHAEPPQVILRGGFPCPTCQGQTKIIRTKPERFSRSTEQSRACKNSHCGQVFTTLESVVRVIESVGNPHPAGILLAAISCLAPHQIAAVKAAVADL